MLMWLATSLEDNKSIQLWERMERMLKSLCLIECLIMSRKPIRAHSSPWGWLGRAPLLSKQLNFLISPKQGGDGKTALWEHLLASTSLWDVPGNCGVTPANTKTTPVTNGKGWTLVGDCKRVTRPCAGVASLISVDIIHGPRNAWWALQNTKGSLQILITFYRNCCEDLWNLIQNNFFIALIS